MKSYFQLQSPFDFKANNYLVMIDGKSLLILFHQSLLPVAALGRLFLLILSFSPVEKFIFWRKQ